MRRFIGGTLLGVLCGTTWLAGTEPSKAALMEYSAGHLDVGLAYDDGELDLHYHFGGDAVLDGAPPRPGGEYHPSEVYTRVADSQQTTVPAGYEFTGASAGETLWFLPQGQIPDVPFMGFATEELEAGEWLTPLTYSLTAVAFPNANAVFSLWNTGVFGQPNVLMSTVDGISPASDRYTIPTGTHAHTNWGFSQPGLYGVEITAFGTHATDGFVSDTETLWFAVGDSTPGPTPAAVPEPGSMALLGISMAAAAGGAFMKRRRERTAGTAKEAAA